MMKGTSTTGRSYSRKTRAQRSSDLKPFNLLWNSHGIVSRGRFKLKPWRWQVNRFLLMATSVHCGDWHLGWGFGGYNKLGKLTAEQDGVFLWKGHSQGRHGQTWNKGAFARFRMVDGRISIIEQKGSMPIFQEILNSLRDLEAKMQQEQAKAFRRAKKTGSRPVGVQITLF